MTAEDGDIWSSLPTGQTDIDAQLFYLDGQLREVQESMAQLNVQAPQLAFVRNLIYCFSGFKGKTLSNFSKCCPFLSIEKLLKLRIFHS